MASFAKSLFSKLQGGKNTTEQDISAIAVKYRSFEVIHEGWLTKLGDINKNWQRRWFILVKPRTLFYFEDQKHAEQFKRTPTSNNKGCKGLAKGSIGCESNFVVNKRGNHEGRSNVFTLKASASAEREFVMSADSDQEMSKWFDAIREGENFGKQLQVQPVTVMQEVQPTMVVVEPTLMAPAPVVIESTPLAVQSVQIQAPASPVFVASAAPTPVVMQSAVVIQQPATMMSAQPAPATVVVQTLQAPQVRAIDAATVLQLMGTFENVQKMNQLQQQQIRQRLAELGAN